MDKLSVTDLELQNKKVLVRVDFNVPMDDKGKITDDTRIRAALPTINYLLKQKAAVILCAHLGRPKGKVNPKYSLKPVALYLGKLLKMKVAFAADCVGEVAEQAAGDVGIEFLYEDFRPLFREGQERARELGFYMQKYCGCVFSEQERYLKPSKIIP